MSGKFGAIFMLLGTVLLLAALSLFLYNRNESKAAAKASQAVMPALVEHIQEQQKQQQSASPNSPLPVLPNFYETTMTTLPIDGNDYIGCLSIPSLNLQLPVLSDWDYNLLTIAPCRFAGSTKDDSLIIAAHNYDEIFWPLYDIEMNAEIIFTDVDGLVWRYQVVCIEMLDPTAVEEMVENDYDLTLFTCTYGGAQRYTVRCIRQK